VGVGDRPPLFVGLFWGFWRCGFLWGRYVMKIVDKTFIFTPLYVHVQRRFVLGAKEILR